MLQMDIELLERSLICLYVVAPGEQLVAAHAKALADDLGVFHRSLTTVLPDRVAVILLTRLVANRVAEPTVGFARMLAHAGEGPLSAALQALTTGRDTSWYRGVVLQECLDNHWPFVALIQTLTRLAITASLYRDEVCLCYAAQQQLRNLDGNWTLDCLSSLLLHEWMLCVVPHTIAEATSAAPCPAERRTPAESVMLKVFIAVVLASTVVADAEDTTVAWQELSSDLDPLTEPTTIALRLLLDDLAAAGFNGETAQPMLALFGLKPHACQRCAPAGTRPVVQPAEPEQRKVAWLLSQLHQLFGAPQ